VFSSDGKRVAAVQRTSAVLWDLGKSRSVASHILSATTIEGIAFSRDGKQLMVVDDNSLGVADLETGKTTKKYPDLCQDQFLYQTQFSTNGRRLAVACDFSRSVDLIDLDNLDTPRSYSRHRMEFVDLMNRPFWLSGNGHFLAVGNEEKEVTLYKSDINRATFTAKLPFPVFNIVLDEDGDRIAAIGNTLIGLIDRRERSVSDDRARACEIANRNLSTQEWNFYFGEASYHKTCPQFPSEDDLLGGEPD